MTDDARRRPLLSIVLIVTLVLVPNVMGVLANIFPQLLSRSVVWSYAVVLELLSVMVIALVLAVVIYILLTPGRRRRRPRRGQELAKENSRRFLPPLEMVLLQIGNLTYLAFALILGAVVLAALCYSLRLVVTSPPLLDNNFKLSLGLAVVGFSFTLRPSVLRKQSWAKLSRLWIQWPGLLAIAVAGIGAVGALQGRGLLKIDLTASELRAPTLTVLYVVFAACMVASRSIAGFGPTKSPGNESSRLPSRFASALGLAWAGTLGMCALYLNGAFLTLYAHLART